MTAIPLPDNPVSRRALQALLQQRTVLAALEVFHAALGDVFRIPLPGFNPVMLVGPEANRFVLVEQRGELRWRVEKDPITRLLRHGVLVEDGEAHDTLRRQMNPALHRAMLTQYVETMWRCTDAVIDTWAQDQQVDMLVAMRYVALRILTQTLFGVDSAGDIPRLWRPILRALRYISPGWWVVWRDVPRPGYRGALRELDAYLYRLIADQRGTPSAQDTLLALLLESGMPDDLIRDQLMTLLIAGHDTSTALLSWALHALARHPEMQSAAQQEVDDVLGTAAPDHSQLGQLTYLEQVINETLRVFPPIHLGSRIAAADLDFQGFQIPAGTRVLYSIYLTHRDPRHWDDPAAFCPERFSPQNAHGRAPYTFLPFGGGPRNCMGMAFAQVEAKVVLARILQKFELRDTGAAVRMHMGATLEPRPGVRVTVHRRG